MKLLILDTEISLQLGYFYDQWNTNIPAHKIKHHGFMISAAWQWYGQNKTHSVSVLDDPKRFKKNHRDDYHVAKTLKEQIDEADAVLAFNGDNFDIKEINTALIKNNLAPAKPVIQIDPYKLAKRYFRFKGGNSLANLTRFLSLPSRKEKLDDETWIAAAEGCPKAIKKVVAYNRHDIPPLIEIYERIRPFVPAKLNANHFVDGADVCPNCASPELRNKGRVFRGGHVRKDWLCGVCGHRFPGKIIGRIQTK